MDTCRLLVPSKPLLPHTAVRAHEQASLIPRLHRAKTVAWGVLNGDRGCMIVARPWSTRAGNAWLASWASSLGPRGFLSPPQDATQREAMSFLQKPTLIKGGWG